MKDCLICKDIAVPVEVYIPSFGNVQFCKYCLLSLPSAIVTALAEYLPE